MSKKRFGPGGRRLLTQRQQELLKFLRFWNRKYGSSPTLSEIGEYMGIRSSNGVEEHLNALETKGCIRRSPNQARSIVLLNNRPRKRFCEVVGSIRNSILAEDPHCEDFSFLPRSIEFPENKFVFLRILDDSFCHYSYLRADDFLILKDVNDIKRGDVLLICDNSKRLGVADCTEVGPDGVEWTLRPGFALEKKDPSQRVYAVIHSLLSLRFGNLLDKFKADNS